MNIAESDERRRRAPQRVMRGGIYRIKIRDFRELEL